MSDEKIEETPKKAKKADTADAKMEGMNWEAIHRKVELYGVAAILAPYAVRNLPPIQLKLAVDKALAAARAVIAVLDADGTEGKA